LLKKYQANEKRKPGQRLFIYKKESCMKKLLPFALLTFSMLAAALFAMSPMHSVSAHASASSALAPILEINKDARFFGNPNHKAGDRIEFSNPVYDAATHKFIGHSDGECFYVSNTEFQCNWSLLLSDGTIDITGAQASEASQTVYAIVGGTGAYEGIRGEVLLTAEGGVNNDGEATAYVYHFRIL
jgi:hypothetical protein